MSGIWENYCFILSCSTEISPLIVSLNSSTIQQNFCRQSWGFSLSRLETFCSQQKARQYFLRLVKQRARLSLIWQLEGSRRAASSYHLAADSNSPFLKWQFPNPLQGQLNFGSILMACSQFFIASFDSPIRSQALPSPLYANFDVMSLLMLFLYQQMASRQSSRRRQQLAMLLMQKMERRSILRAVLQNQMASQQLSSASIFLARSIQTLPGSESIVFLSAINKCDSGNIQQWTTTAINSSGSSPFSKASRMSSA